MDNNLKLYLNDLYSMANNKINSKFSYHPILNCLQSFVSIEKKNSPIFDSLDNEMNRLIDRVNSVDSSSLSQFPFWIHYIKWMIWHQFRNSGIGHLSDFYLNNNRITCTIQLNLHINKEYDESKEDFEKRKELFKKFLNENKLTLSDNYLINNEHNHKFLLDYINSLVDGRLIKIEIINNCIHSITFSFLANSKFLFKKFFNYKEEKNDVDILTNAELENISKNIKEWYDAITLCEDFSYQDKANKLSDTATHLISTLYFNTCQIVGLDNEVTQQYKQINLPNKERNLNARKQEEIIGSQYDLNRMFDISKQLNISLSNYIAFNFGFYLKDFHINEYSTIVMSFDSYNYYMQCEYGKDNEEALLDEELKRKINIESLNSIFDITYNANSGDAYLEFNDKNKNVVENIIANELCSEISNIEINYKNGKPIIKTLTYHLSDWNTFLRKFGNEEEEKK